MEYLPAPDPERFLPWKIGERVLPQPPDLPTIFLGPGFEPMTLFDFPISIPPAVPIIEIVEQPPTTPPMSRKFHRSQQIHKAAVDVLKHSLRPKPRYLPGIIWRPLLWVALRICFG